MGNVTPMQVACFVQELSRFGRNPVTWRSRPSVTSGQAFLSVTIGQWGTIDTVSPSASSSSRGLPSSFVFNLHKEAKKWMHPFPPSRLCPAFSLRWRLHSCDQHHLLRDYHTTRHALLKLKTKIPSLSSRANYTDRATAPLSAKLVPTFADRGCRLVSATIPTTVFSEF
jgi:hypothetical protein